MHRPVKITAALVLALMAVLAVAYVLSRPRVPAGSFLAVELNGNYHEGGPARLLGRLIGRRAGLLDVLDNLNKAANDERIKGVIVRVNDVETGWARARDIRNALEAVRIRNKPVVALLRGDHLGGNLEYYVASVADLVYVTPAGSPLLNGLSAQYFFLGGVWEKVDVAMEVEQIREYKTAGDMLSRRSMSAKHREMANALLDSVNREFLSTIAEARSLPVEEMEEIVDSSPASPQAFVEAGLADGIRFFDDILAELGEGEAVDTVSEADYSRVRRRSLGLGGGPTVAVVHAAGTLVAGGGDGRGRAAVSVGSDTLAAALAEAASDGEVKAIVLRIDSPGGSASASDQVWRQVRLAAREKPLVASLGDVGASGGYYMAVGADRILADAATLTGSIGIVLFKPNIAGLLGRVGVGSETLGRGRYSRILDITKGLDRAERSLLKNQMERVYQLFLDRVAEGRGMTVEEVDRVAGGRVWTGRQARELGLIDELGGLADAVRVAARRAGIDDIDRVELSHYPRSRGLVDELSSLVSTRALAELGDALGAQPSAHLSLGPGLHALAAFIPTLN